MTTTVRERVAGEIRAELARQQISQVRLAEMLGKSDMYVSRRLSDGTSLDAADVLEIANVLGVPASRVLPAGVEPRDMLAALLPDGVLTDIAALAAALGVPASDFIPAHVPAVTA